MGADGIWLGLFISNFLGGIMAFSWFLTGSWKESTIKRDQPEEIISEEIKESTESASLSGSSVE